MGPLQGLVHLLAFGGQSKSGFVFEALSWPEGAQDGWCDGSFCSKRRLCSTEYSDDGGKSWGSGRHAPCREGEASASTTIPARVVDKCISSQTAHVDPEWVSVRDALALIY